MAEFLTREGICGAIESVIRDSKQIVFLVSPYLKLSPEMFEQLRIAAKRKVKIIVIYGKNSLNKNDKNYLKKISTIEVYHHKNLHAKCYFNEEKLILTSMNWHEYSQKNNLEMGVLFSRNNDIDMYSKAYMEVQKIKAGAEKKFLIRKNAVSIKEQHATTIFSPLKFDTSLYKRLYEGFCIRCRSGVTHDLLRPFCKQCYNSWTRTYRKPVELYCHTCGEKTESAFKKPECWECHRYKDDEKKVLNTLNF